MEKSAVDWLVEKITPVNWTKEFMQEHYKDVIEQANQIFKEQIIKTWDKRGETIVPRYFLEENISGEQYYEKTFNSEQNDKT